MSPKIFLTGATGYIGGSVFHTLVTNHPEYEISVLLRTVPAEFNQHYPDVKVIRGDYDSLETLTAAAAEADIVIHNGNSDHVPSLRAILAGLKNPTTTTTTTKHLIHLSGTGLISDWRNGPQGVLNPTIWSDTTTAATTDPWSPSALHAETENLIQSTWLEAEASPTATKLKTAVVRPPDIYGRGLAPLARKSSFWIPWLVRETLGTDGNDDGGVGAPFYVRDGQNRRGWVHIADVAALYLALVEAAVRGEGVGWGRDGYYHAATQEASQLELAQAVARILHARGLVRTPEPERVELERVDGMMRALGYPGIARYMFASNARSSAERARAALRWEGRAPGLWEVVEEDVGDAVEAMGDRAFYRIAE